MIHIEKFGFYDNGITVEASLTGPFRLCYVLKTLVCVSGDEGGEDKKTDLSVYGVGFV